MIDWLNALRTDLDAELGHSPKVATLATVNGTLADARSVVVREIGDDGLLTFTSDGRSDKNAQLRVNPSATLVFWLPKTRRQYRMAGAVSIASSDDPRRQRQWERLSPSARVLFLWPSPGEPRSADGAFHLTAADGTPMPASFEVLLVSPTRVETLDLGQSPHVRIRWTASSQGWQGEAVNP